MARYGKCDFSDLKKLQKRVQKMVDEQSSFIRELAQELAKILDNKITKRTPVLTGALRRGWKIEVRLKGNTYEIVIINPLEYASYVEEGHRTPERKDGTRGWVKGKFMMTISVDEVQNLAPRLLEKTIEKKLGECFNDKLVENIKFTQRK